MLMVMDAAAAQATAVAAVVPPGPSPAWPPPSLGRWARALERRAARESARARATPCKVAGRGVRGVRIDSYIVYVLNAYNKLSCVMCVWYVRTSGSDWDRHARVWAYVTSRKRQNGFKVCDTKTVLDRPASRTCTKWTVDV